MNKNHIKNCEIILTCKCGAKIKWPTRLTRDRFKVLYIRTVEEQIKCPSCKKEKTIKGMTGYDELFKIYDF